MLDELERRCVKEALGIWSGYSAFCEESAGAGAEKPAAVVLVHVADRIEDMKARAKRWGWSLTRGWSSGCARTWRRRGAP